MSGTGYQIKKPTSGATPPYASFTDTNPVVWMQQRKQRTADDTHAGYRANCNPRASTLPSGQKKAASVTDPIAGAPASMGFGVYILRKIT